MRESLSHRSMYFDTAAPLRCNCVYLRGNLPNYPAVWLCLLFGCLDRLQEADFVCLQSCVRKRRSHVPPCRSTITVRLGLCPNDILGLSRHSKFCVPTCVRLSIAHTDYIRDELSASHVRRSE
jgi:hypothetical protein